MMCHPVTPPTPVVFIAYPTSLITVALHVALIAVLAWLVFYKRRELAELRRRRGALGMVVNNSAKSSAAGNRVDPPTRPGPAAGPRDGGAK